MGKKSRVIGIITKPLGKPGIPGLKNLIRILIHHYEDIYVITSSEAKNHLQIEFSGINIIENDKHILNRSIFGKTIDYIYLQFFISKSILYYKKKVDTWIFYYDSQTYLIPVFTTKIIANKIVFMLSASIKNTNLAEKSISGRFSVAFERLNFYLADIIIIYTRNLITEWKLERFEHKIIIFFPHHINLDTFNVFTQIEKRDTIIGYIGRFSEEKGVINFVHSFPTILSKFPNVRFFLIGDGDKKNEINAFILKEQLQFNVQIINWINNDDLPVILNKIKIIVMPSYSEGLPKLLIESMACGTPVLSTPVGSIPDIITDCENGFQLKNNSPEIIAESIENILFSDNINNISDNARKYIENKFSLEIRIREYAQIRERI